MHRLIWLLFLAVFLTASLARAEEPRVALIIGNARYTSSPLANPGKDAELMARTLKAVGFDVTVLVDGTQRQMKVAIRDFGAKLTGGVGLFYYAGHGMQVNGRNYLIPIDAKIEAEVDVDIEGVDVATVLAAMEKADSRVNLVVLDACRDNPFARASRSGARGLAFVNAPTGTLISYATAPGSVASDGAGQNGTFTASLSKYVGTPGLAVEEMFKRVRSEVIHTTSGRQTPWESSSLVGSFSFVASGQEPVTVEPAPSRPAPAPQGDRGQVAPEPSPAVAEAQPTKGTRVRAFAGVAAGYTRQQIGEWSTSDGTTEATFGFGENGHPFFGLALGGRVDLGSQWQVHLPALVTYQSDAGYARTSLTSGSVDSVQSDVSLEQWGFSLAPTVRYRFAEVPYVGLGAYGGFSVLDVACSVDAATCGLGSTYPELMGVFGGLAEGGVLLMDGNLNIGLQAFVGTNGQGPGGDFGANVLATWAIL